MPILDWLNKDDAIKESARVPYRLFKPVKKLGYGDPESENMLIQGDNLEALKSLLPNYAGRVKCIYIDPPYNTKSAFEHYDDNLEHSQWLSMIYPRLELLRDLLAEDGSIWVSIDDREGHYLKVIMDELFGRGNFVTGFIWQKVDSPNDNKVPITPDHEHILCYEKNTGSAKFKKKEDESLLGAYNQKDEHGRSCRDRLLKKNGKNSLRKDRPTMYYPLTAPDGSAVYPVHDDGQDARWSHSQAGVEKADNEGRLIWKQRKKNGADIWVPYIREFAPENPVRPHPTILLDVKTTRQAKAHQREVLPVAEIFDTVKPEQLIKRVFEICTEAGDLVLDSFLGSGTTAAVAHKMGRRYIGIEMGGHAETHCQPRLRKVVDGEQGGISASVGWQGGGGFAFYRLGETVFDEEGRINPEVRFPTLAAHLWFSETKHPWRGPHLNTAKSPFLGIDAGVAYALLYNGILGDKSVSGGNVLTRALLRQLREEAGGFDGPWVIYGEKSLITPPGLQRESVTFKQTPYDIKAR